MRDKAFAFIGIALAVVGMLGGYTLVTTTQSQKAEGKGLCAPTPQNNYCDMYFFGTPAEEDALWYTGWLVPANTTILTSFVTNKSLKSYVSAMIEVLVYRLNGSPNLTLGLYINGVLMSEETSELNMSNECVGSLTCGATLESPIQNEAGGQVANFSRASMSAGTVVFLNSSIHAPAYVTVAVTFSQPVWVRVYSHTAMNSFEASLAFLPGYFPANLDLNSMTLSKAPHTLSIEIEART